ncbi:MAG: GDP-mannose 4,6-dehydratase, partial [Methanomicrobia archaeon]|nr:GDP-mannose 4,6-dehydratase [Methanomicrobia archaeon]
MKVLKGRKVLITGSTGFIGANLVRRFLKIGAEVHILTRTTSNKWRIKGVLKDV